MISDSRFFKCSFKIHNFLHVALENPYLISSIVAEESLEILYSRQIQTELASFDSVDNQDVLSASRRSWRIPAKKEELTVKQGSSSDDPANFEDAINVKLNLWRRMLQDLY